ncbi:MULTISPECIES: gp53-like domain-containing protein [Burkholderia]|uniref:gp53-like domain-containing protein n=1 Tax=Burkholderia TaxID=32008 RepID=UPI001FB5D0A2|nr:MULTISPECIES: hypothetical protein [Burkholderia]UXU86988.1 hypothetical protein LXM88_17705 [Burkholderia sp. S-53]
MTNLIEIERWEDGVYQLETSDPVVGGPDGIDNLQAKQLANRTRFLKKVVEAGQSDFDAHVAAADPHPQYATHADLAEKLAALVAQSPETLDTLSELAKALGNDPNFATTITNQLGLKAALDSPVFTGTPKGPTPPQFDGTEALATAAFVQRALGNNAGLLLVNAAQALTASAAGKLILLGGTTGFPLTLPPISSVPSGTVIEVQNIQPSGCSIVPSGTDLLQSGNGTFGSYTGIGSGWSGRFVANKVGVAPYVWQVIGGSLLLRDPGGPFAASLGGSGYQKLPSGMIFQWVTGGSDGNGIMNVTLPIAFPNAVLGGIANEGFPGGWGVNTTTIWAFDIAGSTLSTAFARVRSIDGTNGPGVSSGIAGRIFCWGK